jgi:hypothetical protein
MKEGTEKEIKKERMREKDKKREEKNLKIGLIRG